MGNAIGIIIINYNQYGMTSKFLESLSAVKNSSEAYVYIVDASTYKEKFNLKGFSFKHLVVEDKENKGYAYGVNEGVKYFLKHGIDKFCVVNNDVVLDKNFLVEMKKTFAEEHIFGGKIYYAGGYEYYKNRYKKSDLGKVLWYAGGINDWANSMIFHRGVDEVDHGQYDQYGATDSITGCLLCFDKKVWETVGAWDESYFLYFEDADFCERAKRAGFKLTYNPRLVIWHKVSQSTGGSGSGLHWKHQTKNRIKFGLKYAPWKTKLYLLKEKFFGR
ncbi:hypothetical protein A2970_00505 [Candidatus Roizmanbacteria bacterium RIFCSPLOWO2_01_FULL_44_13]|uniref:Glycosyltransferase 2-like domain-containing protein n=1 Tax=Candidatus Roizmanbacteria bacterium RIFCSPLOWO2_01_FULL_44_13 TaxID=1802069 RepID=A0A1F7JBX8_9BACT|nr:MAG: hypothetical protein A2970_00505 [Candidatus Roizmanbacteria bacterium RIFCSPLOWO2_01_FULL_44_13]